MKRITLILCLVLLFELSSCTYSENPALEDMLSRLPSVLEAATQSAQNDSGFQKLYKKYAELNTVNFINAEKEMNSIINTKYSYGVSAYNQSNGICDTASMFFDEDSAQRLGIYFKLLGYTKREYEEDGNTAAFTCEKDSSSFKYEVSYDEDDSVFEITVYKDEDVSEAFRCFVTNKDVKKEYYDGNIKRLIVSRSDAEKNVYIEWYDTEFTEDFDVSGLEPSGIVMYENGTVTGS